MTYITLNNGVKMPVLGLGTYKLSDPEVCKSCVLEAIRAGYRLIDTADDYGNEEAVGAGIRAALDQGLVKREELFVTTKVWFKNFGTEDCRKALERSFKKLGLEYIDLVLLHWPFGDVFAAWRVLEEYYEAGRIKAIGVSNMSPARLVDLVYFNKVTPAVNQIETFLYSQRRAEKPWLAKYGVTHQAYSPLGQGNANEMFREPAVIEAAKAHGKTPAQVLLRFLIQDGASVIPKSQHIERIRENLEVFDFELTEAEMESLRKLDRAAPMDGRPD
ncbi:MAG: aldo/keto reductase, partial [Firmicutes bacterium]|nr:aldo/keto reductase [Bacillota bacterium]